MGFYSWAFLLIRRSGATLAGAISIYIAYMLGLFILTTFLALLNRGKALIVPILIHSLGSIVAAATFGPLMADETWGTFLLYLLLSILFSLSWIFVDWRLAYSGNKGIVASEASS